MFSFLILTTALIGAVTGDCTTGGMTYMCKFISKCASEIGMVESDLRTACVANGFIESGTQCCKVYGDPHIITFDERKFDYMGSCTYVLAQDDVNFKWGIYGTFQPCAGTDPAPNKQVSCITGITVFSGGELVEFLRMFRVNYNGEAFTIPEGQSRNLGDLKITKDIKYYVDIGDTGVRVSWDGIINSEICLPQKCGGGVSGICGDANCDPENDFITGPGIEGGSISSTTSSMFGNSWAVDPTGCNLEEGILAGERLRPCDYIPVEQKTAFENHCNSVLGHEVFLNCIVQADIDVTALYDNCMYDSCVGLTFGAGCKGNEAEDTCKNVVEDKIMKAMATGLTRAQAMAKYGVTENRLGGACVMGMQMAQDCAAAGVFVSNGWRNGVTPNCPADDEIASMRVCP